MGLALNQESWIWYALALFMVACRVVSRTILFGNLTHLKIDDWLMILTIAPYTVLLVVINIVAHTSSNLLEPGTMVSDMSQSERDERIYGSKLILVVEQMQCVTIWLVKSCLLILYYRLTANLPANKYVKALAVYVGVTFCIMEILYFGVWCRPFHNYWALPTPNIQCSAATDHLITNAVFNLSSDVIMLAIGCSLFIRSNLSWSRKLILCGIFGVGIFVILAAVLNKYYSFTHPFGSEWTYWYVRESSTAIIVANLPFLWTLLRRMFKLDSFSGDHHSEITVPYHSSRSAHGRHAKSAPRESQSQSQRSKTHTWNGSAVRHNSQNSSLDLKHIPIAEITTSDPNSPIKPQQPVHRPSWREQGVFGRGDQELMADIEPWDFARQGHDSTLPSPNSSRRASVPIIRCGQHSVSSGQSSPRRDGAQSPGGGRRIRDEEAQYKIQEDVGQSFQFYDGPPESEAEEAESQAAVSSASSDFEGKELEFETSALDAGNLVTEPEPARRKSTGSERRRSLVNKVAPALWTGR